MFANYFHKALNSLIQHPGFMRYFTNTSWLLVEKLARIVAGLFVGVWVARYLGPEQFGLLSFVVAFVEIFSPIPRYGLDKLLVRDLISESHISLQLMGTAFFSRILGALLAIIIVFITLKTSDTSQQTTLYILIASASYIFLSFEVIELQFQSQVKSRKIAICRLIQLAVAACLKIYFIQTKAPIVWFVYVILFENLTYSIALMVAYANEKKPWFFLCFNYDNFVTNFKRCVPLILSGLVLMVQIRIDQVMLKAISGDQILGYYSASVRLLDGLSMMPALIVASLFPAILHAKKLSELQYKWRLYNLYRLMMVMFLAVYIPLYFVGEHIILLLYGADYAPSAAIFSLMLLRLFFINYEIARNIYLVEENYTGYIFISTAIGALINVVLNYLLIPAYGGQGAVVSTLISFFISTFVIDFFNPKTRSNLIDMYKSLLIKNLLSGHKWRQKEY